jgi:hypothetical protein
LEQAGNASNVKWRAARVRIDHLLSSAIKAAQETTKSADPAPAKSDQKPAPDKAPNQKADTEASAKRGAEEEATEKTASSGKSDEEKKQQANASGKNDRNRQEEGNQNPEHPATGDGGGKTLSRKTA